MTDLGAQVLPGSGFATIEPFGINDMGEIIGNGTLLNGDVRAVLLEPVGNCNGECQADTTGGENVTAAQQKTTTSMTALQESRPTTILERLRSQMRQRYQIPGQH